jgi:hypothetical protein
MAAQSGRSGRQLGLYVPLETAEKLKTLSGLTEIPQSRLLRQALTAIRVRGCAQAEASENPKVAPGSSNLSISG